MDEKQLQIKKALSVFVDAADKINKLLDKRSELRNNAVYKSPQFDKAGSQHNNVPDKFVEGLANVDKVDKEIYNITATLREKYLFVRNLIDTLYPDYNTMSVLQWRYINGQKWEGIAEKLGLEVSYVRRLHRKGIQALSEKNQEKDGSQ